MTPEQVQPIRVIMDLEVKALKGYSKFLRSLELESGHQMQFNIMPRIPLPHTFLKKLLQITHAKWSKSEFNFTMNMWNINENINNYFYHQTFTLDPSKFENLKYLIRILKSIWLCKNICIREKYLRLLRLITRRQLNIINNWVLWHINPCMLSNAKFSLYIYIKYVWFGLVGFYGI